jgi:hypothetical protein
MLAGWVSDPIPNIVSGKHYLLAIWVKELRPAGSSSGSVWFYLDGKNGSQSSGPQPKVINSSSLSSGWRNVRGEVIAGAANESLWINYRSASGVTGARLLIDDATVSELD